MYGLQKSVCVVSVIPVSVLMFLHMLCLSLCMSEVIYSFESKRARFQVFTLIMLFVCVILHAMWSGNNMQLSAISMMLKLC